MQRPNRHRQRYSISTRITIGTAAADLVAFPASHYPRDEGTGLRPEPGSDEEEAVEEVEVEDLKDYYIAMRSGDERQGRSSKSGCTECIALKMVGPIILLLTKADYAQNTFYDKSVIINRSTLPTRAGLIDIHVLRRDSIGLIGNKYFCKLKALTA
ncbi:hypothetical protein Tdes44962_MAKER08453 [Teratosphaeria destructans]|uniref:Uncharacterized protein n=1 Tax=Teratosphaeria destructans TaxID=418781 RepID=A0A9W7SWQ9_9PEZI|nr:hypothetical protein Tdes44962_MAKER08453 [Teratosphaeria destructans]